jgi:hypothetical protein
MGFNREKWSLNPKISSEEKENSMPEMDTAAQDAAKELDFSWTTVQVAQWWAKWYLKAGHKRLGRVLMGRALTQQEIAATKVSS